MALKPAFEPFTNWSVTVLTEQETNWINELAARLRLIQTDTASAEPEKRREFLQEEVARKLNTVPQANRKRFIEALLARFPVAGQILKSAPAPSAPAPSAQPPPAPAAPARAPETADETLERFLEAASKLPEAQRAELSKRLADAGFIWVDRDALVLEVSDELRQKLGLQGDQQPRLSRVVELAIFLVDALCLLDRTALKTMRELAPRSRLLQRSEDFRNSAARFLLSDSESVEPQWQAMRGLLGGLLAAIQGGGREFGRQYLEQFSPSAIEDIVEMEGRYKRMMMGPNKKECCWEKYKELAGDYATADLVDRRIKDCMASFVEKTILGGR